MGAVYATSHPSHVDLLTVARATVVVSRTSGLQDDQQVTRLRRTTGRRRT
jgi:hypothetical protein